MDLARSPADEAFRAEARAWLRAHVPAEPLPSLETEGGFAAHRAWEAELAADRWSVVNWPAEYGGRDAGLSRWLVFEEEYYAAGAPGRVGQNGVNLLAPTLFDHGTREQRARVLPPMACGEVVWAQAWSEPEAGSDLASLTSRAVRTEGGWLLTGQKTWSSRAAFADRAFGLFRSEPGTARPHQGLTYLMFDLRAPGVTVRPIGRLDGRPAFAELFLDDVFVPDEDVIGEPGQGWRVAMSTAGNERGLTLRSPGRFLASAHRLLGLWHDRGSPASARDAVADALIGARAYELFTHAAASRFLEGTPIGPEASLNKVFWSEYDIALHETALDLLGEEGEPADTDWCEGYVFSLAGPIYAGTNEIQRDIIAERLLGLPKGRR
ncbi:acyl-CoA dehydrogenase family protein [Streptomyces caniscabiei]|uniref:Acyl-CoA dehydrogenase family protein n=1 Tax=Streptomyces caniscabiei TaxID=2746961 RepID=A0ABU4MEJ1_9ACTN|nr:acyl-CoA dehydrogenase family protein [Streptomyces caniscabiei]MBE4736029.1 acyl-CoA dehydrogenase family protein [Streptomyces caniscabiei]MBE4755843.1 acyl-CoA dehydrogenase family protein [Streptomyces caniscabiei]MBE4771569.1 acyl-CoA dehydrogenase family protein [Streptomyces caniscabiei]MBE4786004.1 acyl-CoA dehydrogenase family protein [Streptomyces caniscabiei]MBE4794025.1 acyl-CoA dehydrogenase family protein [Streptomyces caniscabiei]